MGPDHDHDHHDCGHDHSHDHSHDGHDHKGAPGINVANEVINLANAALQTGASPQEVAAGLRHASANFSAFAFFQAAAPRDANAVVEEFVGLFEHYLGRHQPAPASEGLSDIIARAKKDF